MKLFTKTLLLILVLFTVIATATSAISARNLDSNLRQEYRSKGIAIAEAIAHSSTEILLNRNLATVQATIDQFSETSGVAYVFVTDAEGEIVSHTFVPRVPQELVALAGPPASAAPGTGPTIEELDIPGLGSFIHIHAPILAGVAGAAHVGMDLGEIEAHIAAVILRQQLLMLLIFTIVVGIAYGFMRRISRPLGLLADYSHALAAREFARGQDIPSSIKELPGRHGDEIGELAEAFITMQQILQHYLEDLEATTAAKQHIESELKIAHDIQMSMVPKTFPPFPDRHEFDLYATLIPAREVGGDFYDFFFIDEDQLCFVIGDVSGKGVPASLFMALTKTLFRAIGAAGHRTSAEILAQLNRQVSHDNPSCMFVTAFCGVLDTRTGRLEFCNAGHNLPFHVTDAGGRALPGTGDMALGVDEHAAYHAGRVDLAAGDCLVTYTDGVTEAMNNDRAFYTENGLRQLLERADTRDSKAVTRGVIDSVTAFVDGAPPSDDMTLLVLRYLGGGRGTARIELSLANRDTELQNLQRALSAFWDEHAIPAEILNRAHLALDEVLANIIRHAYEDDKEHEILVQLAWDGAEVRIVVSDDGRAFDPLDAPEADIGQSLEERQPGGLGIHLVRHMMDGLAYRREAGRNVLTLTARGRPVQADS